MLWTIFVLLLVLWLLGVVSSYTLGGFIHILLILAIALLLIRVIPGRDPVVKTGGGGLARPGGFRPPRFAPRGRRGAVPVDRGANPGENAGRGGGGGAPAPPA